MPELPEVETTRRGIAAVAVGHKIAQLRVHEPRLRWPVAKHICAAVAGQRVRAVGRRAKYLLFELDTGTLILHLGMSGSVRVVPAATARALHDHVDLLLDSGELVRFNDPRRFGSLHYTRAPSAEHPLLAHLGPEPFDKAFNAEYLWSLTRRRRVAIKQLLMNSHVLAGVGNIYASEALFRARIRPKRQAKSLTRLEAARLVRAVRTVLNAAIRVGGTTLRDYVGTDGVPGYFAIKLFVYERAGEACRVCATLVRHLNQGQRSSYYCPHCQK